MLKRQFFAPCSTPLNSRSLVVFCRLRFFLVLFALILTPGELLAQGRVIDSSSNFGRTIQSRQATASRPTQRRRAVVQANSQRPNGTEVSASGVPAQLANVGVGASNVPDLSPAPAPEVAREASDARVEPDVPSPTANAQKTNEDESKVCYLDQRNGKYTFLRLVKHKEDAASIRVAPDSQVVVVPRKNFLATGEKNEGIQEGSGDDFDDPIILPEKRDVEEKAEKAGEVVDDYVVFILTNLDSDEGVLLRDARDGRWDSTDLLSASLIAEGLTTPEKRAHYRSVYGRLLAMLKPKVARIDEPFQKSEIVYEFLHNTALTSKYDLNSSSVAKALDSGVYNCVSATVLFNCFADASGLNVAALETTGHAKSRVKFDDSYLDIETTCSDWNRLPDRVRPYNQSAKTTDETESLAEGGVPSQLDSASIVRGNVDDVTLKNVSSTSQSANDDSDSSQASEEGSTSFEIDSEAPLGYSFTRTRRPMHEITEVELVATIYYNVGVDFYQAGSYERAVASYIKAIQLAPGNRTILGNLKATLNNWAIDLAAREKRYAAAIQITLFGLALDPEFEEFKVNLPIFFHDWVEYLAKDNKWEEIKRVQEESKRILAKVPE